MEDDSESTITSFEENTENCCENPTRDTLADGLLSLFKPAVDLLDERVRATRAAQLELKDQLQGLSAKLSSIESSYKDSDKLDEYVKKLINVKHKVTIVFNVLQSAQERLNRIHQQIEKENTKRKALKDQSAQSNLT